MSMTHWPAASGPLVNATLDATGWPHRAPSSVHPSARRPHDERLGRPVPLATLGDGALVDAVAGIVIIAAQRARHAGVFDALRSQLLRILDEREEEDILDPRETEAPALPAIDDMVTPIEAERLAGLLHRQRGG